MDKTIIVYYSKTGSNKFLAEKMAQQLACDSEEIKPLLNLFLIQMLLSSFKKSAGIKKLKSDLSTYDRVILFGPVWMGKLIPPLRDFMLNYNQQINKLYFVTCCGSGEAVKNEKYGHGLVFKEVEALIGEKLVDCQALPIGLVLEDDKQKDQNAIMKTRISDQNFNGEIQKQFNNFIQKLKF